MKVYLLAALSGVVFASPAVAAPTYLRCNIGAGALSLTADEANGTVTIMVDQTPSPQRFDAVFGPSTITFGDRIASYIVDRVSLLIERKVPAYGFVDRGSCQVIKAAKRAF